MHPNRRCGLCILTIEALINNPNSETIRHAANNHLTWHSRNLWTNLSPKMGYDQWDPQSESSVTNSTSSPNRFTT